MRDIMNSVFEYWELYYSLCGRVEELKGLLGQDRAFDGPTQYSSVFRGVLDVPDMVFPAENFEEPKGSPYWRTVFAREMWGWYRRNKRTYRVPDDRSHMTTAAGTTTASQIVLPMNPMFLEVQLAERVDGVMVTKFEEGGLAVSLYNSYRARDVLPRLDETVRNVQFVSLEGRYGDDLRKVQAHLRKQLKHFQYLESFMRQGCQLVHYTFMMDPDQTIDDVSEHDYRKREIMDVITAVSDFVMHGSSVTTVNSKEQLVPQEWVDEDPDVVNLQPFAASAGDVIERVRKDGSTGRRVKPHARGSYMRRPRGSAPDAPKTIEVKSTVIHKEEARQNGLYESLADLAQKKTKT